ncbi:hypothetical protein IFT37_04405 [Pseudomonas fluorescens]|uniref:Uncharacterized protein n=1 Tax=Pseudomonas fluorescens TaxID=294 RepID=A0AAE2Q2B5_PSEFL|nr:MULTISPECIES: hypothetical protein [Pseudomonas fluorescens group]AZE92847.1 hypothetical protein C4J96_0707 [Pseudomonas orientalis]AZE98200.1 hypothetical protein C4J95_0716 [Pseudomonas orientalis]MBA1427009.1 hypothetical protein [Pseudomonas orientalis]MBD8147415.1 hypothetical protein [Pseudomonas fluorescens]MBD8175887.1 hypothetical protein [Pseudomonas fluorescens]
MSYDYRQHQRQFRELDNVNQRIKELGDGMEDDLDNETFAALMDEALKLKMDANHLMTSTFALTNYMADKGKIVFDGIP